MPGLLNESGLAHVPSDPTDPGPFAEVGTAGPAALDGYDFSLQVGHLLRRAYQRHVSIFQQIIPDSQLTAAQFIVLCAALDQGPCSLNDLVRATEVDQATARGVVERLRARGLLEVSADPEDRRKVLIRPTARGESTASEMVPFARRISEITLADLNAAERVALIYLLQKLCAPADSQEVVNPNQRIVAADSTNGTLKTS